MGVAERKERDKLARRRDIVLAARECFFKRGFENTTIQQIADRVELSTGTIYLYFKSKEEIYISILEEGLDIMLGLFQAAIKAGNTPIDNLRNIVRAFIRFHNDYGEYLDIMAFMRLSGDRSQAIPMDLQDRVQNQVEACYAEVEAVIQNGIDRGDLRPVNTRHFAQILWAALTGLVLSDERREEGTLATAAEVEPASLELLIDLAGTLLVAGLRPPAGQPATHT